MSKEPRTPARAALLDWRVFRAAVPLVLAGLGVTWLYLVLASGDGPDVFYVGPALALPGTVLGFLGLRGRMRALVAGADRRTAPGRLLVLGGVLVAAGAIVPAYLA